MEAASIGEPPEVPTEILKWSRPVWNSGGVPGTEAGQSGTVEESQKQHTVQQQQSQVRYMRNIYI